MKIYKFIVLLFFFFTLFFKQNLQAQSTKGTEFWVAYMENLNLLFNDFPSFTFYVEADQTSNITIEVPQTGLTFDFVAEANEVTEYTLPAVVWYTEQSEIIDNKGLKITSDNPVRISTTHYRTYFTESSILYPIEELGTSYLPTCYADDNDNPNPSSFVIVSTEDDNEIEIIPSVLTSGLNGAGIPFTIILNEGQNYLVQSLDDLTGSSVQSLSNQKMAVFSGSQQAIVGDCSGFADNHIYDQSLALDKWGSLYHYVPFSGQGGDILKILAQEDNTTIYFDCNQETTLNAGEFYRIQVIQATVISSSAPISIAQFNKSQDCNASGLGDPNMLHLVPLENQLKEVRWFSSDNVGTALGQIYFVSHFCNVITRTENTDLIELDGNSIENSFAPFSGNTDYSYAQLTLDPGEHLLQSDSAFQSISYGFGDYDAYSTNLGYAAIESIDYTCLFIESSGLLCVDSTISFESFSNLDIVSWSWEFGDNATSEIENPTHTYAQIGDYTVTLNAQDSDGSTFMLEEAITIVDCSEGICDEEPNIVLSTNGQFFCISSLVNLNYTSDIEFASVSWDFGNDLSSSAFAASTTYNEIGNYQITFTGVDNLNCEYIETLDIEIADCNECPFFVNISASGALCVDSVITFSHDYPAGFNDPFFGILYLSWYVNNETTGFESQEDSVDASFFLPGTYSVDLYLETLPFCSYYETFVFEIVECADCNASIDLSNSGNCLDSLIQFEASSDVTLTDYNWEVLETGDSSNDVNPSFSFSAIQDYTIVLTATAADGCSYTETLIFTPVECGCFGSFELSISGNCLDSLIQFTATSSGVILTGYNWEILETGNSSNDVIPNFIFTEIQEYTIFLTATASDNCTYSESITFTPEDCSCNDLPLVETSIIGLPDNPYCTDSLYEIFAQSSLQFGAIEWTDSENNMSSANPFAFSFSEPGIYTFTLEGSFENECDFASVNTEIIVEDCADDCSNLPELTIASVNNCLDSTNYFIVQTDANLSSYFWDFDNNLNSIASAPSLTFDMPGTYTITLEAVDEFGCDYLATTEVTIELCEVECNVFVPNIFTPDGNNRNDEFSVLTNCPVSNFSLQIFERWGGLVFESTNPEEGWNGIFDGKKMASDVYVYKLEYTDIDGVQHVEAGNVTLSR